jgi:hypothetical protein
MASISGPNAVSSNLTIALDSANPKSYQYYPQTTDHGISTWYCFVSGTATYSIINANVSIFQNNGGVITTVVSGTTNPQRGTITVTAGCTYYGNGPIFLMIQDGHQCIDPISMAGTRFANYTNRLNTGIIYIYSPYTLSTVSFYDATASGINSTATQVITLKEGEVTTIPLPNLGWSYISATNPVLCTTTQNGADKKILTPASTHVYNRSPQFNNTVINTTPTTVGSYYVTDTTNLVVSDQIADGAGGDANQGLGYQHLCDRYSWGDALSDYQIVAPYSTTVTVSYWTGSSWTVWDTHVLSGTQTAPVYVARDGTNGPGVAATLIQGAAANMASGATGPWKWEGTNPFYLCINDTTDDEYSMLGWLNSKQTRLSTDFCLSDTAIIGAIGIPLNGAIYNSNNGGNIAFDGTNDYVFVGNLGSFPTNGAIEFWMYSTEVVSYRNPFHTNFTGSPNNIGIRFEQVTGGQLGVAIGNDAATYAGYVLTTSLQSNTWYNVVVTWNTATSTATGYLNAVQGFTTSSHTYWATTLGNVAIGAGFDISRTFKGNISSLKIYNKYLTTEEVKNNFNAYRGRFGI